MARHLPRAVSFVALAALVATLFPAALTSAAEGTALSDAFRSHGELFPRIYSASLVAGEKSGGLETVIQRITPYGMPATSIVLSTPVPPKRLERQMVAQAAKKPRNSHS